MANKKASEMVKYAVNHGFLPHPSEKKCMDCGKQATEYDHRNYDYPLGVDAVCRSCNVLRGKAQGTHELKKEETKKVLAVRIDFELFYDLQDMAIKETRSLPGMVRHILKETVEVYKHEKKD